MLVRELPDTNGLFAGIRGNTLSKLSARKKLLALGVDLAARSKDILSDLHIQPNQVLFSVLLRGGAMMYPGFLAAFPEADFCMVALRRTAGGFGAPKAIYCSGSHHSRYKCTVFLDCISGTGRTILQAQTALKATTQSDLHLAAVICSTRTAQKALSQAGIGIFGYSLNETLDGPLVLPDFGSLDAGDIFSSVSENCPICEPEGFA